MLASLLRWFLRLSLVAAIVLPGLAFGPRLLTDQLYDERIYWLADAPAAPVAIVFGAGLRRDGRASLVLRDRIDTAAALYRSGQVDWLLLSGDNHRPEYDEPGAMRAYALQVGIPADAIVVDRAGLRTYDTCVRARDHFGITDALLVSQHYHLDRALLTCDNIGLNVNGVAADLHSYPGYAFRFWWLREFPATTVAMWDLFIDPPDVRVDPSQPGLLGPHRSADPLAN